ncbi:penicillin-binding protein [Thermincola ferriacetica]|uniref:Penicillin-binding protein 1A n=1 Tax=Thermincola ferriacetica TaxID=281456 RepID=A0A0L6W3L6_9FIRM|nr:penicillin-binding protein 1A [Thermincola ferriacetica]KNZ70177.1 penicillin-binding protein [Thermincola ferriacetica]
MTLEPSKPVNKKPKPKKRRKLNLFRLFLFLVIVAGLLLVGAVSGIVLASIKDVPAFDPKALEPNLPTYIYDINKNPVTKIYVENREPIKIQDVPNLVKNAFLAIEDVRFYDHKGIDLRRIIGAAIVDIKEGRAAQGASTITQQLVKKAFLNPDKNIKRKIQEVVLAIKLEREYTKDQILEMYLNRIYFGHGAYGLQSAAQIYFNKDVKELTLDEAAVLAGLPQAPSAYDPYRNPEAALKRRNVVLDMMAKYDFISQAQAEEAKNKAITLKNSGEDGKKEEYPHPYFVDYVTDVLLEKYGENKVFKGGLKVYTTMDPKIQTIAEQAMANPNNFPRSKTDKNGLKQPEGALVILDPHTGYIKALVGGREHSQKLQFNRATDAKRQPGSAFKPIIAYAPAIEKGAGAGTVVVDEPVTFGKYKPENSDGKYRGPITLREAVTHSVNVVAVKVLKDTGITNAVKFAKKLGITSLTQEDENLALALGGLHYGVTPLELAGAYGAFANKGIYIQPTAIIKVEDRYGKVIDEFKPRKRIAMKDTTAYIITDMLKSVVQRGTGTRASLGKRPVAGKTGTTNQGKDIWFAGYTPELVGVVWMGHDDPKPMPRTYGGTYPAKLWKEVMSKALKDREIKDFDKPAGLVKVAICTLSGKRAGKNCPQSEIRSDWFVRGTAPSKICNDHTYVSVEVCADSGLLATEYCPNKITRSFLKRDKEHTYSSSDIYVPTQTCNIHGPNNRVISICTDPSHGGTRYLANIPGPGETGGCPPEYVVKETLGAGETAPLEHCPIPEHQVYPKSPDNPGIIQPEINQKPEKPAKPGKVNLPAQPEITTQNYQEKDKRKGLP